MKPTFGVSGSVGVSPVSNLEIRDDRLIEAIERHGARLAWTRATICPCGGWNDQTRQPDPACPRCRGGAVVYFGPKNYTVPENIGQLNALQNAVIAKDGASVIRGFIQRVTQAQDFYDVLGNWVRGTMMVTVRPENKIGYYDRLVNLDSEMCYSEVITYDPASGLVPTRYPVTGVNAIISDQDIRYEEDEDFVVTGGVISFLPGSAPAVSVRLSVHYLMHPTWLVIDHPHVLRESQRRKKVTTQSTPIGNPTPLPIQGAVRLEFLPERELPPPVSL